MDEFAWLTFGMMVVFGGALLALGKWYPGSGAEQVDWKPTRSIEQEIELELEDVAQMIEAQNERRRADGRPELTEDQIRAEVAEEELRRSQPSERPGSEPAG